MAVFKDIYILKWRTHQSGVIEELPENELANGLVVLELCTKRGLRIVVRACYPGVEKVSATGVALAGMCLRNRRDCR